MNVKICYCALLKILFVQQTYCEINTGNCSRPSQMLWCCESISLASSQKSSFHANFSVVIHRPGSLLIIGPNKDWVKYELEEQLSAKSEGCLLGADVDGVHFVTQTEHCFIQYVPGRFLLFLFN